MHPATSEENKILQKVAIRIFGSSKRLLSIEGLYQPLLLLLILASMSVQAGRREFKIRA